MSTNPPKFAAKTEVPVERTKAAIEALVKSYGADRYFTGWESDERASVAFRISDRFVKFTIPIPPLREFKFDSAKRFRSESQQKAAQEQEERRRWRVLLACIRGKLEAVQTKLSTFEQEFLAAVVMPDGRTVGEHVTPVIAEAYASGKTPRLLLGSGD